MKNRYSGGYFADSFPKDKKLFTKIYVIHHFEHGLQVELLINRSIQHLKIFPFKYSA